MVDLRRIILIDQHAHSLLRDFRELDAIGFRQAFSETSSISMLENHVQNSLHYMHMLKQLGQFLDIKPDEQAILEMRSSLPAEDYVQMLFDAASISSVILDTGYEMARSMSLMTLADLCGRPIYRCNRIETVLENCFVESTSFEELCAKFRKALIDVSEPGLVALKTIAAYRGGLEIEAVSQSDARKSFQQLKADWQPSKSRFRIERCALYHFILLEAFALAQQAGLPVQIHTGIGDRDADLRLANPLCFRWILEAKRFAKTTFVFLHCFPFVREAAFLAALYNNVFFDLSLSVVLNSPQSAGLFLDALSLAPFSKILLGTDGHNVPETFWYASESIRIGLTGALDTLIAQSVLTEDEAMNVAAHLFHKNARTLYRLDEL